MHKRGKQLNQKGITLMALIITIIVLLILSGVTISAITGNNGMIEEAKQAKDATEQGEELEKVRNAVIAAMSKSAGVRVENTEPEKLLENNLRAKGLTGTLTETGNGTWELMGTVGEIKKKYIITEDGNVTQESSIALTGIDLASNSGTMQILEEPKAIGATKVPSNAGASLTYKSSNPKVATVDSNGNITAKGLGTADITISGSSNTSITKTYTITVNTSTVSYIPAVSGEYGTYSWDKEYATSDQTGIDTLTSGSSGNMSVTSWKVLRKNGNTIEMVPATNNTADTAKVRFEGAQGYNNAVKMLNDACEKLYGNGSTITARSIKEEDFVRAGKLSLNGDNETTNEWTRMRDAYSNISAAYNTTLADAYSNDNSWYPNIHELEEKNGLNNGATMGLSEQTGNLIERTINNVENTKFKPSSGGIKPVQTFYWSLDYSDTVSKLDSIKASVLLPNTSSTVYWVASRCVRLNGGYCSFDVRFVSSGRFMSKLLIDSGGSYTLGITHPLFPVVSLSSELISGNTTTGFSVN